MTAQDEIKENDISRFNRFLRLPCRVLRRHVFHGVKEDKDSQTIECLFCGDIYTMHKEGRIKIEKSLWDIYQKYKDQVDLSPPPQKHHKKRWDIRYLILGGNKV